MRFLFHKKRFWVGVFLAQFLLFFFLAKSQTAVALAVDFFQMQKRLHQSIVAFVSFSVGDVFYVLLGVWLVVQFIFLFNAKKCRRAGLRLLKALNIFYFLYQIFWGMLYFQTPIIEQLSNVEPSESVAKQLTEKYLQKCIQSRRFVSEDENGVFRIYDFSKVQTEILTQQKYIPPSFSLSSMKINSFKTSLFGRMMNYTGIFGYYNPFTAEAQYNSHLPATFLPFTLAHENAHQLGYAREQEANFIAYIIGRNSTNPDLKYSTEWTVLKYLLRHFSTHDEAFVEEIMSRFSDAMKRDYQYEKAFIEEHSGALEVFFGITNNLFLKSNGQEGSVTYSYFTDLLIRYEMQNLDEEKL